jgi:hypothetical protein
LVHVSHKIDVIENTHNQEHARPNMSGNDGTMSYNEYEATICAEMKRLLDAAGDPDAVKLTGSAALWLTLLGPTTWQPADVDFAVAASAFDAVCGYVNTIQTIINPSSKHCYQHNNKGIVYQIYSVPDVIRSISMHDMDGLRIVGEIDKANPDKFTIRFLNPTTASTVIGDRRMVVYGGEHVCKNCEFGGICQITTPRMQKYINRGFTVTMSDDPDVVVCCPYCQKEYSLSNPVPVTKADAPPKWCVEFEFKQTPPHG